MKLTNKDISSIILSALCFTATAQMLHARYIFTGESGTGITCGSKKYVRLWTLPYHGGTLFDWIGILIHRLCRSNRSVEGHRYCYINV